MICIQKEITKSILVLGEFGLEKGGIPALLKRMLNATEPGLLASDLNSAGSILWSSSMIERGSLSPRVRLPASRYERCKGLCSSKGAPFLAGALASLSQRIPKMVPPIGTSYTYTGQTAVCVSSSPIADPQRRYDPMFRPLEMRVHGHDVEVHHAIELALIKAFGLSWRGGLVR
jgi:hypothetical protein